MQSRVCPLTNATICLLIAHLSFTQTRFKEGTPQTQKANFVSLRNHANKNRLVKVSKTNFTQSESP